MGVGVFSEDFGGYGETFIIDRMDLLSRSNYYSSILEYLPLSVEDAAVIQKIANWLEIEDVSALYEAFQLVQTSASLDCIEDAFCNASRPIMGSARRPTLQREDGRVLLSELSLPLPVLDKAGLEALQDARDYQVWCADCDEDLRQSIGEEIILPLVHETHGIYRDRPTTDCDMQVLADLTRSGAIEVTFKEWASYHWMVGVAIAPHLRDALDDALTASYAERREFTEDYGRSPTALEKRLNTGVQRLLRYLRLECRSWGFDVEYKTSGYTSSSYVMPKNLTQARDRALGQFLSWEKKAA